jgi:parallel beta helix pectate lyase-like protein
MSSVLRTALAVLLPALFFPTGASARTWHVTGHPSGDAPTIQAAIDSSAAGDTVLVAPGTYVENINLSGKDILLRSTGGPEVTIIDGSNVQESAVLFISGESNACVLEGFTITGGKGHLFGTSSSGGGALIYNASPTIRNDIFRGNQAFDGGGVYISGSGLDPIVDYMKVAPNIDGNTFVQNTATYGGGLNINFGKPVITNNLFLQNTAADWGGGASLGVSWGTPVASHNTFRGNEARMGGGLHVGGGHGGRITVSFNLIVENTAAGYPGIGAGGGVSVYYNGTNVLMVNNTIVQNLGGGGVIFSTEPGGEVARNIVAQNSGIGVDCGTSGPPSRVSFHDNLLWTNTNGDFGNCGAWGSTTVIANPEFCGPASGDYSVSTTSPALGPGGPMGAFTTPGCGVVPVRESTWGNLKARAWRPRP